MPTTAEIAAAHRERTGKGHSGGCAKCPTTHRGHVACPPRGRWLIAGTKVTDPYPRHLLARPRP